MAPSSKVKILEIWSVVRYAITKSIPHTASHRSGRCTTLQPPQVGGGVLVESTYLLYLILNRSIIEVQR